MRTATALITLIALTCAGSASAQELEYVFSPEPTTELTAPLPLGVQNSIRGLSGPWDLDRDGRLEVLLAQHNGAGGRIHVVENAGVDTWELVYSTAFIDSSANSNNARFAIGTDLDNDGDWEITYVAGNGYKETNPAYVVGAYVWEHDGVVGSDDYGTAPATVGNFYALDGLGNPATNAQRLSAGDIDGDGRQELLVPANGASAVDVFYVLSVLGEFEPSMAGMGFDAWQIEHRVGPRENGNAFGGGSPSEMVAADLDGDGMMEISYHSWNNFVLFNGKVTGTDAYQLPELTAENRYINATETDDVALFGAVVADLDGDGNDEVIYPDFQTGNVGVLDYSPGDDVLQIDSTHFVFDIPLGGAGGVDVGDTDGDGKIEIIVGGGGYTAAQYNRGEPSRYIRIAEFQGGDPKLGSNYTIEIVDTGSPVDTTGFSIIHRDSLGVKTTYFDGMLSKQGSLRVDAADPIFPSGLAYLGDADGDGDAEVALSFQGVDDSLLVVDEVWNADSLRYDRTNREVILAPARAFVRIYEFDSMGSIANEHQVVLPSDYKLSANYPNPFNPTTSFSFTLPVDRAVSVRVYDVAGRLVRTLVDNQMHTRGTYDVTWDGTNDAGAAVASGTYFYSLEWATFRQSRPMVLVK